MIGKSCLDDHERIEILNMLGINIDDIRRAGENLEFTDKELSEMRDNFENSPYRLQTEPVDESYWGEIGKADAYGMEEKLMDWDKPYVCPDLSDVPMELFDL